VTETARQATPAAVAATPRQAGETPQRKFNLSLGSSAVWTERMVATLERGIKGGKWYSLMDKVWNPSHLRMAAWSVIRKDGAPGVEGQSCARLEAQLDATVRDLARLLQAERYEPRPVKRVWIDKLGTKEKRPLGIPTVRDRVVQTALAYVLEPICERDFAEHSYGFRPGRNAPQAIARVETLLAQGQVWVVDADLKGYFDSIPQDKLLQAVAHKVADGRVLRLLEAYLQQGVLESAKDWQPTPHGTPQGAVISPLLANLYLDPLDHRMAGQGREMIRYADDFIILCRSAAEAQAALAEVAAWVAQAGLVRHPSKTRTVNASQPGGFDFLGWHFEPGWKWPREKSVTRFKEVLRLQTRRTNGQSLPRIIGNLNRRLRGWGRYFAGGNGSLYAQLEHWLRMRLRSVLRKRAHRKGRGRGLDHHRYPNAYFAELGLISLNALTRAKRANPA
jgi:RNA-directed DNA polymerase